MAEKIADHVSTRIEEKLAHLSHAPTEPYIFKVDDPLRRENETAYEPETLAIGPYHHGKNKLQMMEKHKLWYLKLLLQRREETSVDRYIMAMRELEKRTRKCYAEIIFLDEDEFVEMMLLDGCFIIELFRKHKMRELSDMHDPIFQLIRLQDSLGRDLLLFENQLPFFILVQLFRMTKLSDPQDNIIDMALCFLRVMLPGPEVLESFTRISIDDDDNKTHLLSLVHDSWCCAFSGMVSCRNVIPQKGKLKFIKCTTELLEAGIKFKKAKENTFLLDIEFKNGVMKILPLCIDDTTECLFRNLIAYEQYRPSIRPKCVSDYCIFMDCLINSAKDVQELRHCGIIDNWLGDDEVISTMFNKLGHSVYMSTKKFCYSHVFNEVNKHCRKLWNIWLANLRQTYFNSPWAVISFLAALVLLLLTLTQTIFSILSYV